MTRLAPSHGVPRIVRSRSEKQRMQDLKKISQYQSLENQICAQIDSGKFDSELFQLTTKILCLNPEYYTMWNVRRRCLSFGLLSEAKGQCESTAIPQVSGVYNRESDECVLQSELTFIIPLLKGAPKCYWLWEYRRWILKQSILRLSILTARQIWETELKLASRLLHKDQRNFHAWAYRRSVVAMLESNELRGKSLVEDEFAYTDVMIKGDLSNFSAWHARSQLAPKVLEQRGSDNEARYAFLIKEFAFVWEGLNISAEDQSLWYYHRFLISQITICDHGATIVPALAQVERVKRLKYEIEEIEDPVGDYATVSWVYEALIEYSLALEGLEQCLEGDRSKRSHLLSWLAKLRNLDPMRAGRWSELEKKINHAT